MGPVGECVAGRISPEIAVAHMLLAGQGTVAILGTLDRAAPNPAVAAMRRLVEGRGAALDALATEVVETIAVQDASGLPAEEGVAQVAAFFDRAVRHSPEASVALYSLGDPAILAAATGEIIDWLRADGLLSARADVLDLGCGIGRVAAALAGWCGTVLALDVSAGMVAEASRRLAGFGNVVVRQTGGRDLDTLQAAAFDLVLAVDSFPYIVQTGTGLRHTQGAARALRPGGALCVLNLSYRGDLGADRVDAAAWAAASGMRLVLEGARPFRLWDGTAFVFRR